MYSFLWETTKTLSQNCINIAINVTTIALLTGRSSMRSLTVCKSPWKMEGRGWMASPAILMSSEGWSNRPSILANFCFTLARALFLSSLILVPVLFTSVLLLASNVDTKLQSRSCRQAGWLTDLNFNEKIKVS